MRFLGIDFGERRIGLAISDERGRIATPLETVERTSDAQAIEQILGTIERESVGGLVMGEPRRLDGSRGDAAARIASFARKLGEATGLEVQLVDEALTSHAAAERVGADSPRLDAVAAQIILQDALDASAPPASQDPAEAEA
jgi:putative Holliday junction resolvase